MEGVEEVNQVSDKHLHWRVNIGGTQKDFDTEITEQIPGKRIAWRSIGGTDNGGIVTFHHLNNTTIRIMVQMGYEPEGLVEKAGDLLGVASRRVQFKVILSASKSTSKKVVPNQGLGAALSATRPDNSIN
jgi:uncharacterized membrane protein